MSKNLGYVNYKDSKKLKEICDDIGLDVYNEEAIWQEAEDYFDETGNETAEVRLNGNDYVVISR